MAAATMAWRQASCVGVKATSSWAGTFMVSTCIGKGVIGRRPYVRLTVTAWDWCPYHCLIQPVVTETSLSLVLTAVKILIGLYFEFVATQRSPKRRSFPVPFRKPRGLAGIFVPSCVQILSQSRKSLVLEGFGSVVEAEPVTSQAIGTSGRVDSE
jgi:hypothetical protein